MSCFTEALQLNLIAQDAALRASVFYPSGGLMDTGLYTAARNRPEHLARVGEGDGRAGMTFDELRARVTGRNRARGAGRRRRCAGRVRRRRRARTRFVIAHGLDDTSELLHRRADAIGRGELPPAHAAWAYDPLVGTSGTPSRSPLELSRWTRSRLGLAA